MSVVTSPVTTSLGTICGSWFLFFSKGSLDKLEDYSWAGQGLKETEYDRVLYFELEYTPTRSLKATQSLFYLNVTLTESKVYYRTLTFFLLLSLPLTATRSTQNPPRV